MSNKTDQSSTSFLAAMPSVPDFLLRKDQRLENEPATSDIQPVQVPLPKTVDYSFYQTALDDRRSAESNYAEIYSQYLEVVSFNEKLLRTIHRFDNYRSRVRQVYENAKRGDQIILDNYKITQKNLSASERAISDMQIENESLRISILAHEEAFGKISSRLGHAEMAMEHANKQFQLLSDEYENRGILLSEADRKIKGQLLQISQISDNLRTAQKDLARYKDENLLLQNQLREIQIHEAGIATLNEELTNSIPRLQKQIHQLEDKLATEREESRKSIDDLKEEAIRLRENKRVEQLVEQSKQTVRENPGKKAENTAPGPSLADRQNWNSFYNRWSQIIDELSSHSAPMRTQPKEEDIPYQLPEQLVSEKGDLDWES